MINVPFGIGDYITNGSSAGRVVEIVDKDPRWKVPALRLANIGLEEFGGNVGMTEAVPDYLLSGWHRIPFEWAATKYGGMEERYVWRDNYRRLEREVRPVKPTFPRKACDNGEEHPAHLWQELHIPTGNPLVEHSQWWQCGEES